MNGRIILLNGTSSSGKTTLARALRLVLPNEFCYYASDQLADAGFRPVEPKARLDGRAKFFRGFHLSIASFAAAGNDLLVEHIVEEQSWADELKGILRPFDVFWVGVHTSVAELERRERVRGDRTIGEALYHLKTHTFCRYDFEVDSTKPASDTAGEVVRAWRSRADSWA